MKILKYIPLLALALGLADCGQKFEEEALPEPVLAVASFVDTEGNANTLRLGREQTLDADWNFPTDGQEEVAWHTSNDNVAITPNSWTSERKERVTLVAKAVGSATVTASLGGHSGRLDVNVLHIADFRESHNGLDVSFYPVASSRDYTSFVWDFGDAVNYHTTYFSVRHTYSSPGTYNVTLTLRGSYGTDRVTKTIYVTY